MQNCQNCNIELTNDDLNVCKIVEIKKYYCQECLLKICKNLFLDNEGMLNDTWDKYEKFVLRKLRESYEEDEYFFQKYQ